MKQIIIDENLDSKIVEAEEPHAGPGEVRIKVAYSGICGSDIHIKKGEHPMLYGKYPTTLGHEFSGIIDEIGEGVNGYKTGQRVAIQPVISCGECWSCKTGTVAPCPRQEFYMTGFSEYFTCVAENAIILSDNADLRDAAMIEPLAVAVHAVHLAPDLRDKDIFISGLGTIGMLTALVAKHYGARRIIVSDLIEGRLKLAEKLGLYPVNPKERDVQSYIKELTGEGVLRVIFECVGNEPSLETCVKLADRLADVIIMGVFAKPPRIDMFKIQDREITLQGALEYDWEDFREAARLAGGKVLPLELLRTQEFSMEDLDKAFELLDTSPGSCVKAMVKIS